MSVMHIGLYFGSFNPIHTGHLIIANHIADYTNVDQVWLVISPQNPLKKSNSLLNEYDRLHLAKLALGDHQKIKAIDIEFQLPKPSYTIDTMAYLTEKYPLHTFSIIVGSDSFLNITKWKNYTILLSSYEFIVYPRPGYDISNKQNAIVTIVNAPMLDISATFIRNAIRNNKSIRYLVQENVFEEIMLNNYYK